MSFRRIFRRTAVSPKIALMSSRPMPHLEQVHQQVRAAASACCETRNRSTHRRPQAMAARDQLQPEFALAQARLAGQQHAQAEDVHEHAVARRALGEQLAQVGAHHVDHVAGGR
jgi:hypothetical protein